MFELYTERARRVIFFGRYEASQFGSLSIDTEHLLLGLLREDRNLVHRFLPDAPPFDSIRQEIQNRVKAGPKVPTSIDLPLSDESKRILAYAGEEAGRLSHRHIGTEHILLGVLREKNCIAADILRGYGLNAEQVREGLANSTPESFQSVVGNLKMADRSKTDVTVLMTLESLGFDMPLQIIARAREAALQKDWKTAHSALQLVIESVVDGIKERLPGDETVFDRFDWRTSVGVLNPGLSDEDNWLFQWRLTLLFVEVLIKRFQQRLNS
jgi:ATP-dependent Clp protease ATP-binding subunit ClpA